MPSRAQTVYITIIFALFFVISGSSAFRPVRNVDFDICYNTTIKKLNTSDLNDARQHFKFDSITSARTDIDRPFVTLKGCEELCGDGFQLWPWSDTFSRLITWVFPSIVLISHFHFAPLGGYNTFAVIAHLLGDPIDSIWAMLTRQEANRRFNRRAKQSKLLRPHSVATIWAAYDELGWQDASSFFFESLRLRETFGGRERPSSAGSAGQQSSSSQSPSRSARTPYLNRMPLFRGRRIANEPQDTSFNQQLDDTEIYLIEVAAQRITSNRSESGLQTWISIGSMLGGLGAAYVRTYVQRSNNQTSHTIAVVVLLFIFISLVKISGNIGAFTSSTAVLDLIQELRRNLHEHNMKLGFPNRRSLFPAMHFHRNSSWDPEHIQHATEPRPSIDAHDNGQQGDLPTFSKRAPTGEFDIEAEPLIPEEPGSSREIENLEHWPVTAPYLGMNSSWRPVKMITTQDRYIFSDRGPWLLFSYSFLFVVGGSFTRKYS